MKKILNLFLLATVVFFTSCSSNDDAIVNEELSEKVMQDFAKNISSLTVPSTMKNSSNTYAQQASSQFTALQSLAGSFTGFFTVPANAVAAKSNAKSKTVSKAIVLNSKTYTWSADGVTITYTISEQSDRYTFAYTIASAEITGKVMDGYQLKDGSYAEVTLYDDNTETAKIKWTINDDITKIEVTSDSIKYVLESNTANNSGNLKLYESSTLTASYVWSSDGSGTFTNHISGKTYTW
ncbi:MAG: hypothetical protein AB8B78_09840 [Polaribacter sp.]